MPQTIGSAAGGVLPRPASHRTTRKFYTWGLTMVFNVVLWFRTLLLDMTRPDPIKRRRRSAATRAPPRQRARGTAARVPCFGGLMRNHYISVTTPIAPVFYTHLCTMVIYSF